MKAAIQVFLIATGSSLVYPNAIAQPKPISLAYQVTYVDNATPTFSPDGKRMIFESVADGKEQLYVMDMATSNAVQLTRGPNGHEDPAWSPDGKKVALVSDEGDFQVIYIMSPDGTGMTRLTDEHSHAIHPNWSPDSKKVIYCSSDDLHPPSKNPAEIYTIDIETRKTDPLISGGINTYPGWSPDGQNILFRKIIEGNNSEIFVANSDGTNLRNLTHNPAFDGWPSWSPDGKRIAFASNRNGNYQIFVMKDNGSDVQLLANTEGRATEPRWSPDGKKIYFTNCKHVDWSRDCQVFAASTDSSQSQ
jgi:TolB protein